MTAPTPTETQTRRIGTGFWVLFWLLALGFASWFFGSWEQQRAFPNQDPATSISAQQTELVLQADHKGHYQANGTINGTPVRFLVDTGATQVAIPASLARTLQLPALARGAARTANGNVAVIQTRIDRLTIGPIRLSAVPATIMPDMQSPILLGMSALGELQLLHRDGTLTLTQHH
ncbi:retropepsin-like aspartic protease family protein [Motiliproteus sediminis]|uniref:retropepsin-like aspartic protease family protein n=1 Tax=Motiliproteus sediminis TaxID=1468178 RepID=UPI001AEFE0C5